jgi:hypothetical protein
MADRPLSNVTALTPMTFIQSRSARVADPAAERLYQETPRRPTP